MGETWTTWVGWIIALLATAVAIKGTIRFDVNKWLKERRRERERYLRSLCPNVEVFTQNGSQTVRPAHVSPVGAFAWHCQLCGNVSHDVEALRGYATYWEQNPLELSKRQKQMKKISRRLGRKYG